jgi:hypothetical protein
VFEVVSEFATGKGLILILFPFPKETMNLQSLINNKTQSHCHSRLYNRLKFEQ